MSEKTQAEETDKKQVKFHGEIECPVCKTLLEVEAGKLVLTNPVKGEYEEFVKVARSPQARLDTTISLKDDRETPSLERDMAELEKKKHKRKKGG